MPDPGVTSAPRNSSQASSGQPPEHAEPIRVRDEIADLSCRCDRRTVDADAVSRAEAISAIYAVPHMASPGADADSSGSAPTWRSESEFRVALRAQEPRAWEEAMARYGGPLRRATASLLRGPMDPDDALGQTWFQAFKYAATYDPEMPPYSWLASICTRVCLTQRGRFAGLWDRVRRLAGSRPTAHVPDDGRAEVESAVHGALARLPAPDREVLTLRYLFGLSGPEVAVVLSASPAAVRQRVLRALRRLASSTDGARLTALVGANRRPSHADR